MKTGIIYGLLCPIAKKIVYVGQTTLGLKNKLAISKTHVEGDYGKWIIQLTTNGLLDKLEIVPLERTVPVENLNAREEFWIQFCNRQHPLINKNMKPAKVKRGSSKGSSIIRYFIIDYKLRNGSPTLKELLEAVRRAEPETPIGLRTLQRDIEDMRACKCLQLFAPIIYSKQTKSYSYSDPSYCIYKCINERVLSVTEILKAA